MTKTNWFDVIGFALGERPLSMKYNIKRAFRKGKLKKIFIERLTEPLHLNLLSIFVFIFGTFRQKVLFDLVIRQQYAFPILWSADYAKKLGIKELSLIEFGVANGAGLMNMCEIAAAASKATGIKFKIFGFDTGQGLPEPLDYRDLPETWEAGRYKMRDFSTLQARLPDNAELILGQIRDTMPEFLDKVPTDRPIGFISIDVDYYHSAKDSLGVLDGNSEKYLPVVPVYLDDIDAIGCNPWTGEYLAVNEYNAERELRKIAPFNFLRAKRIFKNTAWIDRMYAAHIHDHPARQPRRP